MPRRQLFATPRRPCKPHGRESVTQPQFVKEILSRFYKDEVGKLCKTDAVIVNVGQKLWAKEKSKQDKKVEVRKSVMADMRRMGTLYNEFKSQHEVHGTAPLQQGNAGDMFNRDHFEALRGAIEKLTFTEGKLKPGLKLGLYFLIKKKLPKSPKEVCCVPGEMKRPLKSKNL